MIALYPVHFSSGQILLVSVVIRRKTKKVCQQFDTPRLYARHEHYLMGGSPE